MKKYFKRALKFVKEYPYFVSIVVVGLVFMGAVRWENRPNIYRSGNYSDDTDYASVVGAYDFEEVYAYIASKTDAKVIKTTYRASQPYTLKSEPIDVTVDGYELVEMSSKVNLGGGNYAVSGRYLLMTKITVENQSNIPYYVDNLSSAIGGDYRTIRAVATDDTFPLGNWENSKASREKTAIAPKSSESRYLLYTIEDNDYHELFFTGAFRIIAPSISAKDDNLYSSFSQRFSYVELPITKSFNDPYQESLKAIPTSKFGRGNSTTTIDFAITPNLPLEASGDNLDFTFTRLQYLTETERPEYVKKYSNKTPTSLVYIAEVRITNTTGNIIDLDKLSFTIGKSSQEWRTHLMSASSSRTVLLPGEAFTISFENEIRGKDGTRIRPGEDTIATIINEKNEIIASAKFAMQEGEK